MPHAKEILVTRPVGMVGQDNYQKVRKALDFIQIIAGGTFSLLAACFERRRCEHNLWAGSLWGPKDLTSNFSNLCIL